MLDFATHAARSVLGQIGAVEHRVEHLDDVDERLHAAVAALHRATDSIDRHVEALESVGDSLPALTEAVTRLCDQLAAALVLAAPVEAAEREVQTGLRRLLHFGRRRPRPAPRALTPAAQATPPNRTP